MSKLKNISSLIIISLFLSLTVQAQTIEKIFSKYSENKSFRYVSISKGMINLASLFGKEDAGNNAMISRVDEMKVLTLKAKRKASKTKAFFTDVEKVISSAPFESLMEASENGVHTKVYSRVIKKDKTDILIFSKSDTVQHFIWLNGNISVAELQKMIKK
ncbi:MAG: DUF4252 domain-containing protein [Paludibacteraceae bacterium]|nr:DUF4252 domain-containing protein [Paludibacteraceae bacterium]